jgi:hypothetical protein
VIHQKIELLANNSIYPSSGKNQIQCLVYAHKHRAIYRASETERYSIKLRIIRDGLGSEQVKKQKNIWHNEVGTNTQAEET